jgi:4-diphosphocytidyl-2-C-methyl-D-erythritol kinase
MILFPPAKINLGLNVLFKRKDGYHELETVMVKTPLTDVLEILPSETFEFKQTGLVIPGSSDDNLCTKAFKLIKEAYNIPDVYIHLRKITPMGAGLGGGSADGAYVLSGLNELFQLNISKEKLETFAAQLGSDCPFFIEPSPQIARGRGELLTPLELSLKGYYIKLINIGIHIGTKEAYAGIEFSTSNKNLENILVQPISTWKYELKNDFETTIFKLHPSLMQLKEELYTEGAEYAAMSGSGSTIFGIYKEKPASSLPKYKDAFEFIGEMEMY